MTETLPGPSRKNTILKVILLCVLLIASVVFSKYADRTVLQKQAIQVLEDKKMTVTELTALAAISATALAVVPDDSTTPVASQIANLSSYLVIVVAVILFEKFFVGITGFLTFLFLFPSSCVLGLLSIITRKKWLKKMALQIMTMGIAVYFLIPVSTCVIQRVDTVMNTRQTIEEIREESTNIDSASKGTAPEEESRGILQMIGDTAKGITDTVINSVTYSLDYLKHVLSLFIDATASLVMTCFLIPLLILFIYQLLIRMLLRSFHEHDPNP